MSKLVVEQIQKPGGSALTLPTTAPTEDSLVRFGSGNVLEHFTPNKEFSILYDGRASGSTSGISVDTTDVGGKKLRHLEIFGMLDETGATTTDDLYLSLLNASSTDITSAGSCTWGVRNFMYTATSGGSVSNTGNAYGNAENTMVLWRPPTQDYANTTDVNHFVHFNIYLGQDLSPVQILATGRNTNRYSSNNQNLVHFRSYAEASEAIASIELKLSNSDTIGADTLLYVRKKYEA